MNHVAHFRKEYPRPQFVRDNWMNLNGIWQFAFDDNNVGEQEGWYRGLPGARPIRVPFAYQTPMSGIEDTDYHRILWYGLSFRVERVEHTRVILWFEGVDYACRVYCNGRLVGTHEGGYCRFSCDITDVLGAEGDAYLALRVEDDTTCTKPRGKQSWLSDSFGCWYAPTSGIWKTVWLEQVSPTRLARVKMTPVAQNYHMIFEYEMAGFQPGYSLRTTVTHGSYLIARETRELVRENHSFSIDLSNDEDGFKIHWWTPENPQLYDVLFEVLNPAGEVCDCVYSYTAFRLFYPSGNKLMLNLYPVYLRMVLEQSYWRESGLTPPDGDALLRDLELAKELGFNGVRMHQKIEDERFYYYADILGMLVFCEMPSPYEFKDLTIERVTREWMEAIKQNYNHPSIVAWVPVNESWGVNRLTANPCEAQFTEALYHLTKAYDSMRPVISNDGWEHTTSDIVTFHNYCQDPEKLQDFLSDFDGILAGKGSVEYSNLRVPFVEGHGYAGQPILMDEFAGIGFRIHDDGWGYGGTVSSREQFAARLAALVKVVASKKEFAGFCVTQLTDVYMEINGLLDFDRNPKEDLSKLREAILQ